MSEISKYIFDIFKNEDYEQIDIIYPSFISLAEQKCLVVPFLPFSFEGDLTKKRKESEELGLPIFEPSKVRIFRQALEKYIKVFLYKIILEAKLSEFSARTVAMEHASEKTKKLIARLNLSFRKERRRLVTQRQIESFSVHKI